MLRLAGRRINPRTNGPHRAQVLAVHHAQEHRRRRGEEGDAAAQSGARLDRLLAGRQTLRVHATRGTTASSCGSAIPRPGRRSPSRPRSSTRRLARRANGSATAPRCSVPSSRRRAAAAPPMPTVPTGPNIQEHRGKVAPVRTYQDLLTSAARRSAVRLLRDEPARVRRRRQRPAHAGWRPRCSRRSCRRPTATSSS